MDGQEVLASSAFLIGILMGFILALMCMAWLGATASDDEPPP